VAKVPPLCTKVVVVELKRMLVEKKVRKEGVGGQPAGQALASTLSQLSPSTSSCSPRAQTTDQKHQKQGNFPSFFSKVPFIYFLFEIFDFMTCNDGKQKHAMEQE
jgi:hypothetical protein